ncbi:MAG TPA: tetratricopeptide repeat protein [Vicinamibacterales bacterium]
MKTKTLGALLALALAGTLMLPAPAAAADKETRQMMADIRILQEQSQQLQNQISALIATLNESIKAVNARMEEQTNANRKSMADQKLVIDTISNDLRVLREKVDDNSVRVGSLGQEIDALRQSVSAIGTRPAGLETAAGDPAAAGVAPTDPGAPPVAGAAAVGTSPKKLLDGALADYFAGQYDLAALGFESYVRTFPQSPEAPEAQLRAGNSYLQTGKNDKAVDAYDVVIRTYPKSSSVAEAYLKKGQALMNLKQYDRARESFDYVVKNFAPDNASVSIAQQRLIDLKAITAPPPKR